MKKRSLIVLLIAAVFATMFFTACGKKEAMTLEKYISDNPEIQKSIETAAGDTNVKVEVKGNEVLYSSDLSKNDQFTEELAKSDEVVDALDKALGENGSTFGGIAKTLEEKTELSGLSVTVNYNWGDEVLVTKTFTSKDAE